MARPNPLRLLKILSLQQVWHDRRSSLHELSGLPPLAPLPPVEWATVSRLRRTVAERLTRGAVPADGFGRCIAVGGVGCADAGPKPDRR